MTPSRLRWGLLFVAIGAMLLLNNTGSLSWEYWWNLLFWWPLILIAIGIEKIFLKTSLRFISYLAPFILVVAMIWVAVDTGSEPQHRGYFSTSRWSEKADSSVRLMEAVINHDRTDLSVIRNSIDLASGRFDRLSRKPKIDFDKSNGVARLELGRGFGSNLGIFDIDINGRRFNRAWTVSFSDGVPLRLTCRGRSANVDLDLESIPLEDLKVDDRDGDVYLKVGLMKPAVNINVTGRDARLKLRFPEEAGIKIDGEAYKNYLERKGFSERGGYLVSRGCDTSKVQIMVKVDDDLENFSLESY